MTNAVLFLTLYLCDRGRSLNTDIKLSNKFKSGTVEDINYFRTYRFVIEVIILELQGSYCLQTFAQNNTFLFE